MPIPNKITGGGNHSLAQNVLRVAFSKSLSASPLYKAFDNGGVFPGADPLGSTAIKEAFTGTLGNSNKPEWALVDTSLAAPGASAWLPANATAGAANPNRLKGDVNYVASAATPGVATPAAAPFVAGGASGGLTGTYRYGVSFVIGTSGAPGGETIPSNEVVVSVTSKQVDITSIPLGPAGTVARRIYRTVAGGATNTKKFVAEIADNTTTIYTDNIADGSLGAAEPTIDTSCYIRFNVSAEFPADSAVPSLNSQNVLLEVLYQYTGLQPTLTYWFNEGSESVPVWVQLTPGGHGLRLVNAGIISGQYKFTLPQTGVASVDELWVS